MHARPSVSVCMATYNGSRYVREQIDSVLPQLQVTDELVVVDDASTDDTVAVIQSYDDARIRLFVHAHNAGVIVTFEEALLHAQNDILFLSDMDDRWAPDKVDRMLSVFADAHDVQLVQSGLAWMDREGRPHAGVRRRRFSAGFVTNLIENTFQGSAMALRRTLLPDVLPFPKDVLFLHDGWIGTRAALLRRGIAYVDAPLLIYRRHGGNVSGRLPLARAVGARLQMLWEHAKRLVRR